MGYNGPMAFLFSFFFGLSAGSFLNALLYRMERGQSVWTGRSRCPSCGHQLSWYDLIPLVSFALLRGRCRYCEKRIALRYPIVELGVGVAFVLLFHLAAGPFSLLLLWALSFMLFAIALYDAKHLVIPETFVYLALALALLWRLSEGGNVVLAFLSAVGAAAFFLAIFLVSRGRWMGFGDVELVFFMGLLLSWPAILVSLYAAFLTGAGFGITLIFLGKRTFGSQVPFAPFLVLGTFVTLLFGENLVNWYLHFFL